MHIFRTALLIAGVWLIGVPAVAWFTAPPAVAQTCVNINTASASDLERIIHIGPVRAQEIITKRPFRSVDDLTRVSGISDARLRDIKAEGIASVSCGVSTPAPMPAP